jgi:UDP-glucose 4-epimerase
MFVQGDILSLYGLCAAMGGADVVVHLASSVDMRKGLADPTLDIEQCAIGTQRVLEAMRVSGSREIMFSSSSTVYGEPSVVPTAEHNGPFFPISMYGAGKLAAEGMLSAYGHLHGMNTYAFRFGNVVGDRMNHGVVHDFIAKLKRDPTRLHVLGDGNQAKNYFLVEDCVEGILAIPGKLGSGSHAVNLGCPGTMRAIEIARIVIEEMRLTRVAIDFAGGLRGWPGDVPLVHFDLGKAGSLGWSASTDSAGAVRECVRRLLAEWTEIAPSPAP